MSSFSFVRFATFLLISLLVFASNVSAQDKVAIDSFRPAFDEHGFITVSGSAVAEPGQVYLSLWHDYSFNLLDATPGLALDHRLSSHLMANVGLFERFSVGLDLPFLLYQDGPNPVRANGFGDIRLRGQYRLLGESDHQDGLGLALAAELSLPTSSSNSLFGDESINAAVQINGDIQFLGAGLGVMVGFRHRFETSSYLDATFRDELSFGVGLKIPLPLWPKFGVFAELRGQFDAGFADADLFVMESDAGVEWRSGTARFRFFAGGGLSSGYGAPDFRSGLAIVWKAETEDADKDGIPDSRDECKHLPEDFDGFEDEDGCSDPDNDNDFIPDVDDACPNEMADEDNDENEDGCPDRR